MKTFRDIKIGDMFVEKKGSYHKEVGPAYMYMGTVVIDNARNTTVIVNWHFKGPSHYVCYEDTAAWHQALTSNGLELFARTLMSDEFMSLYYKIIS